MSRSLVPNDNTIADQAGRATVPWLRFWEKLGPLTGLTTKQISALQEFLSASIVNEDGTLNEEAIRDLINIEPSTIDYTLFNDKTLAAQDEKAKTIGLTSRGGVMFNEQFEIDTPVTKIKNFASVLMGLATDFVNGTVNIAGFIAHAQPIWVNRQTVVTGIGPFGTAVNAIPIRAGIYTDADGVPGQAIFKGISSGVWSGTAITTGLPTLERGLYWLVAKNSDGVLGIPNIAAVSASNGAMGFQQSGGNFFPVSGLSYVGTSGTLADDESNSGWSIVTPSSPALYITV